MSEPLAGQVAEIALSPIIHVARVGKIIQKRTSLPFFKSGSGENSNDLARFFKCRKKLDVGGKTYHYFSLKAAEKHGFPACLELPTSMKILLENLLRFEDGHSVTRQDIEGIAAWLSDRARSSARSHFVRRGF